MFSLFLKRHDHSLIPSNNMLLQLLSLDVELMNPKKKRKAFLSFDTTQNFEDSGPYYFPTSYVGCKITRLR